LSQKGEPFGRFTMLDYSGTFEFAMFGKEYMEHKNMLTKDYILVIKGKFEYNERNDRTYCRFQQLSLASEIKSESLVKSIQVDLTMKDIEAGSGLILQNMLEQFPGSCKLLVYMVDNAEKMDVKMVARSGLDFGPEVKQMLEDLEVKYSTKLDERWKIIN
jgi:DNA polymerase-3 subunit alpha